MSRAGKKFVGGLVVFFVLLNAAVVLGVAAGYISSTDPLNPEQPGFSLASGLRWVALILYVASLLAAVFTFVTGWRNGQELRQSAMLALAWKIYRVIFLIAIAAIVAAGAVIVLLLSIFGPVR